MTTGFHAGLARSHDLHIVFQEDNERDRTLIHEALCKAGFSCQIPQAATKEIILAEQHQSL
jgi:hypothetical protein